MKKQGYLSRLSLCLLTLLLLAGCGGKGEEVDLDSVTLDLRTHRFDLDMHAAAQAYKGGDTAAAGRTALEKYWKPNRDFIVEWMFDGSDSMATDANITLLMSLFVGNPHGQALLDSVAAHFPAGNLDLTALLTPPFKRYHHYFPDKAIPAIVTFVDGYPPTAQTQLDQFYFTPRYLGIGLHWFMGSDFRYYPNDLPQFIRRRCNADHLPALLFRRLAENIVKEPALEHNPVLMDYVVCEGIRAVFLDKMLPDVHDTLKLFYTATQYDWANLYEGRAYKEMLPQLQTVDPNTIQRYIQESPFTQQLDRSSAPRLGWFLGRKIVMAYLEKHPEATLAQLVATEDYSKIFKASGYRPPKSES